MRRRVSRDRRSRCRGGSRDRWQSGFGSRSFGFTLVASTYRNQQSGQTRNKANPQHRPIAAESRSHSLSSPRKLCQTSNATAAKSITRSIG